MKALLLLLFLINPGEKELLKQFYVNHSGNVAYNLGVIKYEKGEYAEAIYWWRVATLINPGDRQAEENIKTAKRKLGIPQENINFNPRPSFFNPNLFALLFLIIFGFFVFYTAISAFTSLKVFKPVVAGIMLIISVVLFIISFYQWKLYRNPEVCVVVKITSIYAEPRKELPVGKVRAGTEFKVMGVMDRWVEVKTSWGGVAWLQREAVRLIRNL